jgi:hypothetical protein
VDTTVVTSCSAAGWEQYGRRFVETFCEHWPAAVTLIVYSEDLHVLRGPGRGVDARVTFRLLHHPFLAQHAASERAQGRVRLDTDHGWTPKKIAGGYNFRYDAYRFAKKVFAIEAAAEPIRGGRLFWVDADVVTFAPVPPVLFERMLPEGAVLSCLDRGEYHSECGFVGYNLDHPDARGFIAAFAGLYSSGRVFELKEWHDSWVFDWLRRRRDIAVHRIAHQSRHQPFVNSELGRYMDHLKGASKEKGKTPLQHLLVNRDIAYWRA